MMLSASAPLMFAVVLLCAPEVAVAANVCLLLGQAAAPPAHMSALSVRPLELITSAAAISAGLFTVASLKATAAPMLAVPSWVAASPSAFAVVDAVSALFSVTSPDGAP